MRAQPSDPIPSDPTPSAPAVPLPDAGPTDERPNRAARRGNRGAPSPGPTAAAPPPTPGARRAAGSTPSAGRADPDPRRRGARRGTPRPPRRRPRCRVASRPWHPRALHGLVGGPVGPEAAPALVGLLDDHERDRLARFRRPADRARYLAAHALARLVLAPLVGRRAAALAFDRTCRCGAQHGKPVLPDGPGFSLSHAGDLVGVAVRPDGPVGLDVEQVRDVADLDALAGHVRSPAERARGGLDPAAFFRTWTRKEALVKATGDGLATPDDARSPSPRTGRPSSGGRAPGAPPGPMWLHDLSPAPDHPAAVAGPGDHAPEIVEADGDAVLHADPASRHVRRRESVDVGPESATFGERNSCRLARGPVPTRARRRADSRAATCRLALQLRTDSRGHARAHVGGRRGAELSVGGGDNARGGFGSVGAAPRHGRVLRGRRAAHPSHAARPAGAGRRARAARGRGRARATRPGCSGPGRRCRWGRRGGCARTPSCCRPAAGSTPRCRSR